MLVAGVQASGIDLTEYGTEADITAALLFHSNKRGKMDKEWLRKMVEQKEAKEKAIKEGKLEREKRRIDNIEKWGISALDVILPLLDEYVAEFKRMGYTWDLHTYPTTIPETRKQVVSKITLKAPNAKGTAPSHQIPSMEFTPMSDYSRIEISVFPFIHPDIIETTMIPVDGIRKQTIEKVMKIFIEEIFK